MQIRSTSPTVPTPRRRPRILTGALIALSTATLAACGSADASPEPVSSSEFCDAIDEFAQAAKDGDRTRMAQILADTERGLPEEGERAVSAYALALRGAPANSAPDGDGVESQDTEDRFSSYVTETCGEDALPDTSETTTTEPAADEPGTTATTEPGSVDGSGDAGGGNGDSDGSDGDDSDDPASGGQGNQGGDGPTSEGSDTGSGTDGSGGSTTGSGTGSGGGSGEGTGVDPATGS